MDLASVILRAVVIAATLEDAVLVMRTDPEGEGGILARLGARRRIRIAPILRHPDRRPRRQSGYLRLPPERAVKIGTRVDL